MMFIFFSFLIKMVHYNTISHIGDNCLYILIQLQSLYLWYVYNDIMYNTYTIMIK